MVVLSIEVRGRELTLRFKTVRLPLRFFAEDLTSWVWRKVQHKVVRNNFRGRLPLLVKSGQIPALSQPAPPPQTIHGSKNHPTENSFNRSWPR